MDNDPEILDARKKLMDKFAGGAPSRLGGRGTVRRKRRAPPRQVGGDDKKLQTVLKRLGLSQITGIEEVAMLKETSEVLYFQNPKVQASPGSNTYVISGQCETRSLEQYAMPQAAFKAEAFKRLAEQYTQQGMKAEAKPAAVKEEDVPDLIEDFEEASKVD